MQTRIEVKSYFPSSELLTSTLYIVGTPQKTVTLWVSIVFKIFCGSNFGAITIFAAKLIGTFMLVVMPYMWYSGNAVRKVSFAGVPLIHAAKASALDRRLWCVNIAAFGVPVVPPVYCSAAVSFRGLMLMFGGDEGLFSSNSFREKSLGTLEATVS